MEQKKQYQLINITVLLFTLGLFTFIYWRKRVDWHNFSTLIILIMLLTIILVHSIKVFRLYFILYEKKISFIEHLKQYCKVIPVSMIVPFKLGELFRMYCYGYQIGNFFDGIIVILVDRFADTLGLVTMILFISIVNHSQFPLIFYILLAFLVTIIICYLIFPGMYFYWKHNLLKAKASRQKNDMLLLLEKLQTAYLELSILIKGRCSILYLLSLIAWGVEVGGLFICNKILQGSETIYFVSEYLTSALLGRESDDLKLVVLVSILFLLLFYLTVYSIGAFVRKEAN